MEINVDLEEKHILILKKFDDLKIKEVELGGKNN